MSKIVMSMTSEDGENTAYIEKHPGRKGFLYDLKPYYEVTMHQTHGYMPDDGRRIETTSFKEAVHEARAWTGRETLQQTHERMFNDTPSQKGYDYSL